MHNDFMYKKALYIFRRDLRLEDNTALRHALENAQDVLLLFVLNPQQIEKNDYKGDHALQFMHESLEDLAQACKKVGAKFNILYSDLEEALKNISTEYSYEAIYINIDYTPFSRKRDERIQQFCSKNDIGFHAYHDALLLPPKSVLKDDGTSYTVFTPFKKKALTKTFRPVQKYSLENLSSYKLANALQFPLKQIEYTPSKNLRVHGGRKKAQEQLEVLSLKGYKEKRDYPSIDATSILSAHLKFGALSIREVFHHAQTLQGDIDMFISELLWRDFFYHIAYTYPYVFGSAFKKKFNALPWKNDRALFQAWCSGQTGFPIVDAGMRELKATGYMHNRVRMITASFLVKNLHIDWKWGEKYFAQQLSDYDPCVNNGNWQWVASTGCDAQPYFRIFNPWSQQKRFDEEALYIKKWIPELTEIEPKVIHNWDEKHTDYPQVYIKPIVDHKTSREKTLKMYKNL